MRKLYCQNHIVKICGPRLLLCLTAPPQYPLELRFHPQNKLMQKILQNGYHTARMSLIGRVLRRRQECHTLRGGCLAMLGCIHLSLCRAFCKQAALWSSHLKNSVEKMSKTICSCPNCAWKVLPLSCSCLSLLILILLADGFFFGSSLSSLARVLR